MRTLSRSFSNLEQARQDVLGYYGTSAASEKTNDEAAQRKSYVANKLASIKDKLFRRRKKLEKASEKVANINPFITKLMDWLKVKEHQLQRCVPKQLTSAAFAVAYEQCKVSAILCNGLCDHCSTLVDHSH